MNKAIQERTAAIFSALAHPLRLQIMESLREGPCCVCRIIPRVGGEQSNVSHHLAILRRAGVVQCEKRGVEVWYAVADPRIFEIMDLINSCVLGNLEKTRSLLESIRQGKDEG
ncbi:MAG: metalloregulator ArsR/SmtB family transcription factor [candidate division WOR-3 bacterium]